MTPALEKQRRLLLTEAGDTNPLNPEYVVKLVEAKIDARNTLAPLSLDEFLRTALRHRSVSLITRHAILPEGWVARFKAQEKNIAIASMQNLRQVDYLHQEFDKEGIPHVFMKGCGVSLVAVGRLGLRDAPTDVDIMVSEKDTIRAHTLLLRLGFSAHMGATPDKPKIWKQMLFAYPELAYTKDFMTVDLHWRLAGHPRLFPASDFIISSSVGASIGTVGFPTLHPTHARWLEASKLHGDRNFLLSTAVTIVNLSSRGQLDAIEPSVRLRAIDESAMAFSSGLLSELNSPRCRI
jgi:hypothetical protein